MLTLYGLDETGVIDFRNEPHRRVEETAVLTDEKEKIAFDVKGRNVLFRNPFQEAPLTLEGLCPLLAHQQRTVLQTSLVAAKE